MSKLLKNSGSNSRVLRNRADLLRSKPEQTANCTKLPWVSSETSQSFPNISSKLYTANCQEHDRKGNFDNQRALGQLGVPTCLQPSHSRNCCKGFKIPGLTSNQAVLAASRGEAFKGYAHPPVLLGQAETSSL